MYKIIQKRNYLFAFSLLILVPGIFGLAKYGLRLGLDFTGGSKLTVRFTQAPPANTAIAGLVKTVEVGEPTVQSASDQQAIIRLPNISNDQREKVLTALEEKYPGVTEQNFESIGPTIGRELYQRSLSALAIVLLAIILYISWAFRKVNVGIVPAWVYGLSAILALLHDILIVVGIFSLLGHYAGIEIDSLFVTAMLTVLGFSVHDTIVVFDRVRERLLLGAEHSFEETVNVSLNQTLVRSLNTSLTTLLVLTALYLFGGESIKNFTLALLIGITSGTYSSIFVATPLLVVYAKWKQRQNK